MQFIKRKKTSQHTHTHMSSFYFFKFVYGMRALSPWIRDQTCAPSVEVQSLNYWTTREFPKAFTFSINSQIFTVSFDVWRHFQGDLWNLWSIFLYFSWTLSLNTCIFHGNHCEYGDVVIFLTGNLFSEQRVSPLSTWWRTLKHNILQLQSFPSPK